MFCNFRFYWVRSRCSDGEGKQGSGGAITETTHHCSVVSDHDACMKLIIEGGTVF